MFKSIFLIVPCALVSCGHGGHRGEEARVYDSALFDDLQVIQSHRIYFGHQSVGGNIADGLRALAGTVKDSSLRVVPFTGAALPGGGVFAESAIGENGRPQSKFDAFRRNVAQLSAGSLDLALMKLCYADFDRDTDVRKLFENYRNTIDQLQAAHPNIIFIHVTAPLTAQPAAWKAIAKSALGRSDDNDANNLKRCEFNTLLSRQYAGAAIFDLARVESTLPNGRRNTVEYRGAVGYCLVRDYASDFGHLNELGRRIAARELMRTLAGVLRRNAPLRAAAAGERR